MNGGEGPPYDQFSQFLLKWPFLFTLPSGILVLHCRSEEWDQAPGWAMVSEFTEFFAPSMASSSNFSSIHRLSNSILASPDPPPASGPRPIRGDTG